jgi:imidazolonepropionase-like amidohydrolase
VRRTALLLIAALGCRGGGEGPARQRALAGDIAITGVTVVPMDREGTLSDHTVVVRGGSIAIVAPAGQVEVSAARVIDGRGKWLLPGLADMHVHLWSKADLPLFLWNGVTAIRNMFGSPEHPRWRDQIVRGQLDGPTMITAGPILDGDPPTWPGSAVVTTPEAARTAVREQKKAGYDLLKVYNGLGAEVYDAILAEAKGQGMPVDGHVPRAVGIDRALSSGQRTIEHLDGYVPFFAEGKTDAATVDKTAKAALWNCPTLVVTERMARMDAPASLAKTRGLEHVSAGVRTAWDPKNDFRLAKWTPETYAKMRAKNQVRRQLVGDLARAGARLVLGTDTGNPYVVPGFAVHDELALLVEAGLTRWQALRTATAAAAEMLGTPGSFGVVAVGGRADLILVDRDPLADLAAIAEPGIVIVRGQVRTRAELKAAVDKAAEPVDRFAGLEKLEAEGEAVVAARYEILFRDQVVGVETAVLSRLGRERIVRGQVVLDNGTMTYRSTPTSLRFNGLTGQVEVDLAKGVAVARGVGDPVELATAADAVVAPQAIAEFFWYAERLADLAPGGKRVLTAVEVVTHPSFELAPGRFEFTRRPDEGERRRYDLVGKHGKLDLTGRFTVDKDGAPREVQLTVSFGTQLVRRLD